MNKPHFYATGATTEPPTIAKYAEVLPEYIRLPAPKKRDPIYGFTRSYLNSLVLPSPENGFHPPVRSSVIRRPNAKTGVRLINVASLKQYIRSRGAPEDLAEKTPVSANQNVEFLRLPRAGERDPLFGLSRSFLCQLVLPCRENDYRPVVKSHVLRRRGYQRGLRIISVDSLRAFICAHEEKSSEPSMW